MPNYYSPPPPKDDYVSSHFTRSTKPKARRSSTAGPGDHGDTHGSPPRRASMRSPTQSIYVDVAGDAYDPQPRHTYVEPRASYTRSGSQKQKRRSYVKADEPVFYREQVPVYHHQAEAQPMRSRARRASTTSKPRPSPSKPAKPTATTTKPATPKQRSSKAAPEATDADRVRHHIPAGYSLKNWDPTESPILLLGSVFDANSLGKWIYDWTVYYHGANAPLTEVAGDLWLLLIKFAGKMKRAAACRGRIRSRGDRDLVEDFLASGDRIWGRVEVLLKVCEEFMWKVARREKDGVGGGVRMGEKSGIQFVKSIFGRERELERTERLMTGVHTWNMRFDANCEDILAEC